MDIIIEFARSTAGLLTAIAGAIVAIVALMHEFRMWVKLITKWITNRFIKKPNSSVGKTDYTSKARDVHLKKPHIPKKKIVATLSLLVFAAIILGVRLAYPMPLNAKLTNKAWRAYNKKDYKSAIAYAKDCINEFKPAADDEQSDLNKRSADPPPIGEVLDNNERREIFDRGPLNDVATCYWIMGRSAEKLGLTEEARNAYQAAQNYPHGRCWDPKGWFWSPPDDAEGRLRYLEQ